MREKEENEILPTSEELLMLGMHILATAYYHKKNLVRMHFFPNTENSSNVQ